MSADSLALKTKTQYLRLHSTGNNPGMCVCANNARHVRNAGLNVCVCVICLYLFVSTLLPPPPLWRHQKQTTTELSGDDEGQRNIRESTFLKAATDTYFHYNVV